ncbi:3,4-dioxygenase subunit beta [Mycolicibacterium gilvum]|uniref:Protocatechuate 3,4-dioxygenase beta subunit n=1 Tax=Mycolicibacterium gilvum TaxID=1804 RepID=A0A379MP01_9MYCO|nr:3,4-dioxygenase subunit beta [Mycolicibacterium gilvum]MCV7058540.1 3,4-dioxygenase subunit beta [Mycolicibacterium gilvum]SUE32557.1 Protocatechuate 3,4-dioxygenase beta subunit [Mycolicibacterium gilvum]
MSFSQQGKQRENNLTRRRRVAHQGRTLPRPTEDIDEQGLMFDVDTLLNRRRMLHVLGWGAAAAGLAACATAKNDASSTPASSSTGASTTLTEIPDETAGPYPGDGSNGPDVLEQSGIVRSDIRSSFGDATSVAEGVPMTLELTITDITNGGRPFAGAAVYVWHCDRSGGYSLYSEGIEDQNYLRGVQIADNTGKVSYTSIFPACYLGRWPHIHFEVYRDQESITDPANAIATSQVALPKEVADVVYAQTGYEQSVTNLAQVTLDSDNVFGDDNGATQLATVSGNINSGYLVTLAVGIDTDTAPTGGQLTGDGAPPGAPPAGPPGGPGGPPPNGLPPS